jgi:hypothetical protein
MSKKQRQKKPRPPRAELLALALTLLHVDTDTGRVYWRVSRGSALAGTEAGYLERDGYVRVKVNGHQIKRSHIVFYAKHGRPHADDAEIDHLDQRRANDVASNLAEKSRTGNARNKGTLRNNTSGIPGVHWYRPTQKWRARITINGKRINLGDFDQKSAAITARRLAVIEHHGPGVGQLVNEKRATWLDPYMSVGALQSISDEAARDDPDD